MLLDSRRTIFQNYPSGKEQESHLSSQVNPDCALTLAALTFATLFEACSNNIVDYTMESVNYHETYSSFSNGISIV